MHPQMVKILNVLFIVVIVTVNCTGGGQVSNVAIIIIIQTVNNIYTNSMYVKILK